MCRMVEGVIDPGELVRLVSDPEAGGIATFFGTVRLHNAGKRVVAVEYQAYAAMADRILREIGEETRLRHGALRVAILHRVGRLEIGELSIGIAAGARHRREALAAVAHALERVKREAPVWKREFYSDGSAWIEPPGPGPQEGRGPEPSG